MAEHVVPIINFSNGIEAVPGFQGGRERALRDILNQDIDDDGFLVPRKSMQPLPDIFPGVYPRHTRRIYKTVSTEATARNHAHYANGVLTLGLETQPSLIAALATGERVWLSQNGEHVELRISGETLTQNITALTQVLQFRAAIVSGSIDNFENDVQTDVVLLHGNEAVYYNTGDQVVIAHTEDSVGTPMTRVYRINTDDSYTFINDGRFLLIAGSSGAYFIDIPNNIRYDWDLTSPNFTEAEMLSESSEFQSFRARLLALYRSGENSELEIFNGFPLDALVGLERKYYGWRFTYENPELGVSSGASKAMYIQPATLRDPMLDWLQSGPVTVGSPESKYDHVYFGLLHLGLISAADVTLIENEIKRDIRITIDTRDKPDWATHIGFYRTEIPPAFYTREDQNLELEEASALSNVLTLTGTGLISTGIIVASSSFVAVGVPLVVLGLVALNANQNNETITYTIDVEAVEQIDETSYLQMDLHRLPEPLPDTYEVTIEAFFEIDELKYLDALYNVTPPDNFYAILAHAGRIYGVDGETQEIVFSHIDGNGINQWFSFPPQNRIPTTASGPARIQVLEQMPSGSGIYVFKRNSIHYIQGQNIFSGLYDINVSAQTDISAAQYKQNVGTSSPLSVVNNGEVVLFIGSDHQIYTMTGTRAVPIGKSVKPYIKALTLKELTEISGSWYNERFYLTLNDSVLILNTEHQYWTRFDWNLRHLAWDRGKDEPFSDFYAIGKDGKLYALEIENGDRNFPIRLQTNKQVLPTHATLTGLYIYTDDGVPMSVEVSGNEPQKTITREFTPKLGNKYRVGLHVKGRNIDIAIKADKAMIIDRIEIEENI